MDILWRIAEVKRLVFWLRELLGRSNIMEAARSNAFATIHMTIKWNKDH